MAAMFRPSWTWPGGEALHYCVKVTTATGIGYLLSFGGPIFAVYGAFSAALIVGASRGEDVGSASNRVRGSVAGMLVGLALASASWPVPLAVAVAVGLTAYLCMGAGWGIPAARVGASLCAVMVVLHGGDLLEYSVMRIANTLIGIASGLAVSYIVLPVRGRDAVSRNARKALAASSALLDTLSRGEPAPPARFLAVLDGMGALEKSIRDAGREFGGNAQALRPHTRQVEIACLGALMAGLAQVDLGALPDGLASLQDLHARLRGLAERAANAQVDWSRDPESAKADGPGARAAFEQGMRKVDESLRALGR
jgi:hypothetical protein